MEVNHSSLRILSFFVLATFLQQCFASSADFGPYLKVQSSLDKDLTITSDQKRILDKFRRRVEGKLTHAFMKTDLYLVRWLRARNFRIKDAEEMLVASLVWRKNNKIETIHQENWTKFQRTYQYLLDMKDAEGKPILYIYPGSWDLRRAVLSNDARKFERYILKAIDESWLKVYELQEKYQNVTQGVLLVNLDGYNVVQHACLQCIPIILKAVVTYENYYPGLVNKLLVVNTPSTFEPLLQTVRGVLSPITNSALRIYGTNKREWKPILQRYIDRDQLPHELGGDRDVDIAGSDYGN